MKRMTLHSAASAGQHRVSVAAMTVKMTRMVVLDAVIGGVMVTVMMNQVARIVALDVMAIAVFLAVDVLMYVEEGVILMDIVVDGKYNTNYKNKIKREKYKIKNFFHCQ